MSVELGQENSASEVDDFEDIVETDQDSPVRSTPAVLPTIQLSFGNSSGGAWDDRELIKAYDVAMEEFHVHHPGPGSWLDKATAALAKGEPLPGASGRGTAWYSASYVEDSPESSPPTPPTKRRKTKASAGQSSSQAATANISLNPYAPIASTSTAGNQNTGRISPSYAPPSPPASGPGPERDHEPLHNGHVEEGFDGYDGEQYNDGEEGYDNPDEWYDESYNLSGPGISHRGGGSTSARPSQSAIAQQPTAGPSQAVVGSSTGGYGVQPTADISTSDAFSFAMTAQYWAGYWMGVAQSKTTATTAVSVQAPPISAPTSAPVSSGAHTTSKVGSALKRKSGGQNNAQGGGGGGNNTSNVFVTKKQFHRPLRR